MKYTDMSAEMQSKVAALYDGGWRAEDRDEMKTEYDLTDDEVDEICEGFESLAEDTGRKFRYIYSKMTNDDLDGFYNLVEFEADENGFIPHDALSVESFDECVIDEDVAALTEYGYTVDEAREYVLQRVRFEAVTEEHREEI